MSDMKNDAQPIDETVSGAKQGEPLDPAIIGDRPGQFIPQTEDDFNWLVGKITDAQARIERIWVNAQAKVSQEEAIIKYYQWKYASLLQDFVRRQTAGKNRKSHQFFNGVAGFRSSGPKVNVNDEDAAKEWAKVNKTDAVYEAVDLAMVAKALRDSGEVVDFAEYTPPEEHFFVK